MEIGGLKFEDQRFIVVEKMICPIILGIDFWSRVSSITFDFNNNGMILNGNSEEIQLLHHHNNVKVASVEEKNKPVEGLVHGEYIIPPKTESLVKCYIPRMEEDEEYMIQPISCDDTLVSTPYGIVSGTKDKKVMIRITNLSNEEVCLNEGVCIANVDKEKWMMNSKAGEAFRRGVKSNKGSNIGYDSMIGKDLECNKKRQLLDMLTKYDDVFYKGGELPIVRVGIEHTIKLKEDMEPVVFKPRRLSKELTEEVQKHVETLLKQGVNTAIE